MTCNKKYRYYISLDFGTIWNDIYPTNDVLITWKRGNGQFFYRAESSEWKIIGYKNKAIFEKLYQKFRQPTWNTQKILVKIDYYSDNVTFTKQLFLGYVPYSGFFADRTQRIIKIKPKTYDNYSWYEEAKDIKVDLSSLTKYLVYGVQPENVFGSYFMKLTDIMEYVLATVNGGLSFQSELFTSDINPVNGTANGYKHILLQGGGYFLADIPEDYKPEITLADLIDLFTKAFNCGWHINGNWFIVEHKNYYRNGMTYSGTPNVGVDLTDTSVYELKYQTIYNRNGNITGDRFSYEIDGFPRKITYKWGTEGDVTWSWLEYTHPGCDIEKNEEVRVTNFFTDPYWVQTFGNEPDNEKYFVASCDPVNSPFVGYILKMGSNNALGTARNAYMYFSRLLNEFHIYDCYFSSGKIHGFNKTFDFTKLKRIMIFDDFKFPHLEDFEFTDLIQVYLGIGEISTIKLNTDTGFFTATVILDPRQIPSIITPGPEIYPEP